MSNLKNDFRYVMCPGSIPTPEYKELHNKIYNCWEFVWSQTFQELKMTKPLYSDAFTRQDYIGALLYKDQCVGMSFFRWTDASHPEFAKDSYFANWSQEHLKTLCSRGPKIIVCSNYTIHPDARGLQLGVPMRDVLLGMIVETYMNSQADAMTGATRLDRKVNEVCERWGALQIATKVPSGFGDAQVDLVGFFKDHISQHPPHTLQGLTQHLWNNRLEIPKLNAQDDYQRVKKAA